MAQRRMIGKDVVQTDRFLSLPFSVQAFYFQLLMSADDEGFIDDPIQRMKSGGFKEKDLLTLLEKHYLIGFSTGIVAITHWYVQNKVRKDRVCPTAYMKEKALLTLLPNEEYRPVKSSEDKGITVLLRDFSLIFSPQAQDDWMDWDEISEPESSPCSDEMTEPQSSPKDLNFIKPQRSAKTDNPGETDHDSEVYFKDPVVDHTFKDFLEARKALKAPNTPRAISLLVKKLDPYPKETQLEAIETSIMNNWKGVFPESVKTTKHQTTGILDGLPDDYLSPSLPGEDELDFADFEEVI